RPILRGDNDNSDGESNNSQQEDDDSSNEDNDSQREELNEYDSQEDEIKVCVIKMHELTSSEEDNANSDCDRSKKTETAEEYDDHEDSTNENNFEDFNEKQNNSAEKQSKTKIARSKTKNAEEKLEDAEEHTDRPITSQEDEKSKITEENNSRRTIIVRNAEERTKPADRSKMDNQPIRAKIVEKDEENAEERDEQPEEEKLSQSKEKISEKISDIKKEEVGEPFDKKNVSFIHIKRVHTYLRSKEDSSEDSGSEEDHSDLKHKKKRLKMKEDERSKEDPESVMEFYEWRKLKKYYSKESDFSDESEDREDYDRWKRRKIQIMEMIRNNNHRAEKCRGKQTVEQKNSEPARAVETASKIKSLLAERFHLKSCNKLDDSTTEDEEENENSENSDTKNKDIQLEKEDQSESPDELMLSGSNLSEGEERQIAHNHNRIQEIINRRFSTDNTNNNSEQRENTNNQQRDNSSNQQSQNNANDDNRPQENEDYESEGERTIISSGGSRTYNSELGEDLFMDMEDPSEIVYSEREMINIINYNVKFRSNPGNWICEPISDEMEIATDNGCETALTRVRDALRGERHNGRFNRATVVNGRLTVRSSRANNETINKSLTYGYAMEKEKRRIKRWEEDIQRRLSKYEQQDRMLKVREDRLTEMERYARELSPIKCNTEQYNKEEREAQNKSIEIIKKCELARGRNVFDVSEHRVRDEAGKEIAEIKAIYVVRNLRPRNDKKEFTYRIETTISRGRPE
ncbi:probable ATP-dependent helicase PF08_0048, partial [Temnothorax curvispinosus]|uniref:Probable ATP-dependent helicase PF08_0048 n=1 Tax=Temnothorax curvispinosus TaxID=300111 RepID=A0A6J1PSC5_9HYME